MTIYVHRDVAGVSVGGHSHDRPADLSDQDRTWSFDCDAGCETRVLRDVEFVSRTAAGVPLVAAEKAEEERTEARAKRDVTDLAMALKQLAAERAAS